VEFSNGVSENTHKEILMTMAHILDEGVSSFSFRLEGDQPPRRKHPQVEKKIDTVERVTMINGAI
jgi:hypothetical protein